MKSAIAAYVGSLLLFAFTNSPAWAIDVFEASISSDIGSSGECHLDAEFDANDLVRQALKCSPALKSDYYNVQAANMAIGTSGRFPEPKLSLSTAPNTFDNPQLEDGYIVEVSQTLPWFGERALERELADSKLKGLSQTLRQSQIERGQDLRKLYAQWRFHQALLGEYQGQQAILENLARLMRSNYTAGSSNKSVLLQLESQKLRLAQKARDVISALERDLFRIQALSGLHRLHLNSGSSNNTAPAVASDRRPPPTLLKKALDRLDEHPAIANAQVSLEQNTAAQALQKKDRLPELSLMARYNTLWMEQDQRLVLGVGLSLPLDFGKRRSKEQTLAAQAVALRYEQQDLQTLARSRLQQQFSLWRQAASQLELYERQLLPLAQQNLDSVRDDYSAGAADYQTVLLSQERLLATREQHLNSLRQWRESEADFIALSGQLFLEDL